MGLLSDRLDRFLYGAPPAPTSDAADVSHIKSVTLLGSSDGYAGATFTGSLALRVGGASGYGDALARVASRNPYAMRALRLIAETMDAVPLYVAGSTGDPVESPAAAAMLRIAESGGRDRWEAIVYGLAFWGELHLRRVRPVTGSRLVRLDLIAPGTYAETRRDATGDPVEYVYAGPDGRRVAYPAADVVIIRRLDPLTWGTDSTRSGADPRGLPLLGAAYGALDALDAMQTWTRSTARREGRIPGFWVPKLGANDPALSPEQVAAAESSLDARTDSRTAQGRPMVTSGAFDYVGATQTAAQAQKDEEQKVEARKICVTLGVDPALIGDSSNRTYSNLQEARRALYMLCVIPLLDYVLGALNEAMAVGEYAAMQIRYDPDGIDAIQEDVTAKYERAVLASGGPVLSTNEAREMVGFGEVAGGDAPPGQAAQEPVRMPAELVRDREPVPPARQLATRSIADLLSAPEDEFKAAIDRILRDGDDGD